MKKIFTLLFVVCSLITSFAQDDETPTVPENGKSELLGFGKVKLSWDPSSSGSSLVRYVLTLSEKDNSQNSKTYNIERQGDILPTFIVLDDLNPNTTYIGDVICWNSINVSSYPGKIEEFTTLPEAQVQLIEKGRHIVNLSNSIMKDEKLYVKHPTIPNAYAFSMNYNPTDGNTAPLQGLSNSSVVLNYEDMTYAADVDNKKGTFVSAKSFELNGLDINGFVTVRFYYDPSDTNDIKNAAKSFETQVGGYTTPISWQRLYDEYHSPNPYHTKLNPDGISSYYDDLEVVGTGVEDGLNYYEIKINPSDLDFRDLPYELIDIDDDQIIDFEPILTGVMVLQTTPRNPDNCIPGTIRYNNSRHVLQGCRYEGWVDFK